jgi:hypothetical protein
MFRRIIVKLLVFGLIGLLLSTGSVTALESECNPLGETDFCIEKVTIADDEIQKGENTVLNVEIVNVGSEVSNVRVLYSAYDEDSHVYGKLDDIKKIEEGESINYTTQFKGETLGLKELNVMLLNERETHLYDSTGFENSVLVSQQSESNGLLSFSTIESVIAVVAGLITIVAFLIRAR